MNRRTLTSVMDIVGACLLVAFAWFVWPPAALAVGGVALLAASFAVTSGRP